MRNALADRIMNTLILTKLLMTFSLMIFSCVSFTDECRGVGGLFFDDLDTPNQDKLFEFASVSILLDI